MFWLRKMRCLLLFVAGDVEFGVGLQERAAVGPSCLSANCFSMTPGVGRHWRGCATGGLLGSWAWASGVFLVVGERSRGAG